MIDNADYAEVKNVFGRMDSRKKDFDPIVAICQAKKVKLFFFFGLEVGKN
jgi:hypothetical protein